MAHAYRGLWQHRGSEIRHLRTFVLGHHCTGSRTLRRLVAGFHWREHCHRSTLVPESRQQSSTGNETNTHVFNAGKWESFISTGRQTLVNIKVVGIDIVLLPVQSAAVWTFGVASNWHVVRDASVLNRNKGRILVD